MSATWTDPCTTQTFRSPPSEPMFVWLRCDCGYRTSAWETTREALDELRRLHRKATA